MRCLFFVPQCCSLRARFFWYITIAELQYYWKVHTSVVFFFALMHCLESLLRDWDSNATLELIKIWWNSVLPLHKETQTKCDLCKFFGGEHMRSGQSPRDNWRQNTLTTDHKYRRSTNILRRRTTSRSRCCNTRFEGCDSRCGKEWKVPKLNLHTKNEMFGGWMRAEFYQHPYDWDPKMILFFWFLCGCDNLHQLTAFAETRTMEPCGMVCHGAMVCHSSEI